VVVVMMVIMVVVVMVVMRMIMVVVEGERQCSCLPPVLFAGLAVEGWLLKAGC